MSDSPIVDLAPELRDNVRFYTRPVLDEEASAKAGCAKHKDGVYLWVCNPGDKDNIIDRPIYRSDPAKYPHHWRAFQAGKQGEEQLFGTLLTAWGKLTPALIEDYRHQKVLTVEHLAGLSDGTVQKFGHQGLTHRQMARDFLESAKSAAPITRLSAELEAERQRSAALEARLAALEGLGRPMAEDVRVTVDAPAPEAPKKRGRPSKAQATQ